MLLPPPRVRRSIKATRLRVLISKRLMMMRYTMVSLIATAVDFSVFFALGWVQALNNSMSTFVSAVCGGIVAWWLYRFWVFADSTVHKWKMRSRYVVGVLLGIVLNALLMGILADTLEIQRMLARMLSATTIWCLLYVFNRRVVFNQ
jgi:putative flippase GtrA